MKSYPKYKTSEISWVKEIPSHWDCVRSQYLFDIVSGSTPNTTDESLWDGEINWITPADFKTDDHYISEGKRTISQKGYDSCSTTLVPSGSIIFSKRAPIGKVAISSIELCTNQGCFGCIVPANLSSNYFYYLMSILESEYNLLGSGSTFLEISAKEFSQFKLLVPPADEQETIAAYLEDKTVKIDALMAEKQAQVEDLQRYRTSLITETVTHGLNPNAPFHPSGIDWIGDVPEHWTLSKFKFALKEIKDGTHFSPDTATDGYPYVTATDVRGIGIDYENTKKVKLEDFTKLVQSGCEIYKDDVLLVKDGATTGRAGMKVDDTPAVTLSSVAMLRTKTDSVPKFLYYILQSRLIQNQISIAMAGAAMPRITLEKLGNFIALIPPYSEQRQIAEYLDEKTAIIDALIDELSKQLDELALYRKAVISEAVTGKVDVRDWIPED